MANTYTQLFVHAIFAVRQRNALIPLDLRNEIYAYMAGIINRRDKCQSICIGGTMDHVHLLIRIPPKQDIADLVQSIKIGVSNYINDKHLIPFKFAWQEGYGAFSISATHTDDVKRYIENQIEHHYHISFLDEYRQILNKNKVDYDDRYIFAELE